MMAVKKEGIFLMKNSTEKCYGNPGIFELFEGEVQGVKLGGVQRWMRIK